MGLKKLPVESGTGMSVVSLSRRCFTGVVEESLVGVEVWLKFY